MKNLKTIALIGLVILNIGCAEEKKNEASVPTVAIPPNGQPYVPPGTGPGLDPGTSYGGSAAVTIVSLARMAEYTKRPMNTVTDVKLTLNMVKNSGGTFGGTARISYVENGYPSPNHFFTAGSSAEATRYNKLFSYGGQLVWHGVFEDFIGGLVVVIDQIVDLGDGQGAQDTVGGSIWFKNFGLTYAPHPPTYCWFVSLGPYDCRPWPSGTGMNTYASKDPGAGYVKLGTFTGLSVKAAFNNEKLE